MIPKGPKKSLEAVQKGIPNQLPYKLPTGYQHFAPVVILTIVDWRLEEAEGVAISGLPQKALSRPFKIIKIIFFMQ